MSNNLLAPAPPVDGLLLVSLPLLLVLLVLLRQRGANRTSAIWLPGILSLILLLVMIVVNELFRVIPHTRIRYLMPLWPLTALLAGAGLVRLAGKYRFLAGILLVLWLVSGTLLTFATDFPYKQGYFARTDLHRFIPLLAEKVPASDLLLVDFRVAESAGRTVYTRALNMPREAILRNNAEPWATIRPIHSGYPIVWLLYRTRDQVDFSRLLYEELGRVFCERVLDDLGYKLERYALTSAENCPDLPVRLAFDSDIQLSAPLITISDDLLRFDAHLRSVDEALIYRYSLAVHIVDPRDGERVAQGDIGVDPGANVPLRSEIDLGALPPGEYEVHVALYNWKTGELLPARDTETDEVGNMHTLHRFRIG